MYIFTQFLNQFIFCSFLQLTFMIIFVVAIRPKLQVINRLLDDIYYSLRSGWCLKLHVSWFIDLEAKERVMEDMRLALTEQEETQSQMEEMLEDKIHLIQELSDGKTNLWTDCRIVV